MENHFKLTDEMLYRATTYMPIEDKAELAKIIARQCVVDLPTAEQNLQGEKFLALPYIKGENRELKALCLMHVLLSQYLKIEIETPFDEEKFNYYAEGSILNQIERYKSNFGLKDTAFDLLADFKEFRKFVDVEINNLITVSNDPLARLTASIQVFSTPENIKKVVDELKKVSDGYVKDLKTKNVITEIKKSSENNTITEKANNG